MGISEKQHAHVNQIKARLESEGFKVVADNRSERVNFKIREHSLQKIPVIGVFGDREVENDTVTVRRFGSKKQSTIVVVGKVKTKKVDADIPTPSSNNGNTH